MKDKNKDQKKMKSELQQLQTGLTDNFLEELMQSSPFPKMKPSERKALIASMEARTKAENSRSKKGKK